MTDDPRVSCLRWNTPDSTPRLATLQLRNNPTQEHSGLLYTVSIVSKLPGDGYSAVAAIRHNPCYQELGPAPAQNTPNIDRTRKTGATPCAISHTLTVLQNTEYFLGGSSISAHYLPPVNIENIDIPYLLACVEIHQLIAVLKNIVDTASSLQWTVVIFALIWAVTDGGAEAAPCRDLITFSFHICRPQHPQ